jgi:hypothetical protein
MFNPKKANWGVTDKTYKLSRDLDALIPPTGSVENPKKNPALEKYRKAHNVVYDIFNNLLINRAYDCRFALDGLRKSELYLPVHTKEYGYLGGSWDQVNELVEAKFTPIIIAAAKEQGMLEE